MSPESQASRHALMVGQIIDLRAGTVVTDAKNGLKYELKTRPGKAPHFALRPHNHHRAGIHALYLKPSHDFPLGSRAIVPNADDSEPREYVKRREGWTLCDARPSSSPIVSRQTAASRSTKVIYEGHCIRSQRDQIEVNQSKGRRHVPLLVRRNMLERASG